jgi:hypothetical protein
MTGVKNRVPGVVCEVGTCVLQAAFTEFVRVIPGNPELRDQRHDIDLVLCHRHEAEFQENGLLGTVTAYGDEIARQEQVTTV